MFLFKKVKKTFKKEVLTHKRNYTRSIQMKRTPMKIKKIKINNYKLFKDFEINFMDSLNKPLDLIVIAGINGSGKTTLFDFIVNMAKNNDRRKGNIYLTKDINPNKIIYLRVSNNEKDNIISQIKNFIDMIKDNNEDLTIKEANQKARDEINSLFDGLVLKTKFKGISKDIERDILFENDIKDTIKLDELSTGEQQLFIRALSLKMMGLQKSIILIDEPEIFLHPNWQNHILRVYQNIAKDGDNQLIIATHSPQIISSAPNESLRVLVKDGIYVEVKEIEKSYGVEIEEVLLDFMDTQYLRTPKIAKDIQLMWEHINNKDIKNFETIYNKLVEILDINDKDLVLARLEKVRVLHLK